jgi:hypothetical protein
VDRVHALRGAAPSASPPQSPAAGRALPPDVAPGGRPLWRVLVLRSGVAASLWVVLVSALGRGLSVHELAGDGAAFLLMLPALTYALEEIAAHWRRRPPAAHRRAHARLTSSASR